MNGSGSRPRPGGSPHRGLTPTSPGNLVVAAVGTAVAAFLLIRRYFGDIPDLTWLAGLTMAGLAVVEGLAAHNTRARIERRPRAGVLNPLFVARLAVLAKASSLAGAIFAGAYAGIAAWALTERGRLEVADRNLPPSVAGMVGALALVGAALVLERACRVPKRPDEEEDTSDGRSEPER
jgi:hypothetical protein